jgi:carotenoid cleavage dioxygenase-like enzyme
MVSQCNKNLARSILKGQENPIEVAVKGKIPDWVNGTLFRNGPGRFRFGNNVYRHTFDGMATVNKFQIKNGSVLFSNRLLNTQTYKKACETNQLPQMFGTPDLCSTIFDRFKAIYKPDKVEGNDNVNVNVVPFGNNQLYALTEERMIVRLDPNDLSVLNSKKLGDYVATSTAIAHPHVDADGSWINIGLKFGRKSTYNVIKFDANKDCTNLCENGEVLAEIPVSHKNGISYVHSFGLTKNYVVFLEQPIIMDYKKVLMKTISNERYAGLFTTLKDSQTRIHLVNRNTGERISQEYHTDPLFVFHHINAFETEDNQIMADIASYNSNDFRFENFDYDENLPDHVERFLTRSKSFARRITIPLGQKNSEKSIYCEIKDLNNKTTFELGTINYARNNTTNYTYAYGMGVSNLTKSNVNIVKLNVNQPNDHLEAIIQSENEFQVPSEPVFVMNPNGTDEDEGVLLSLVLGDKFDFLIVLDAKTLKEVARAELPEEVKATFTFHGFFADKKRFGDLNAAL